MRMIALLGVLALSSSSAGYTQALLHPVSGVDGGGGTSAGGGYTLLGSVGQAAAGVTTDADTGMALEGGAIPPLRAGSGVTMTTGIKVQAAWNMLSIPLLSPDPRKTSLLPTAISSAFVYLPPPVGYGPEDTLLPGVGFWAKFPDVEMVPFTGSGVTLDTIPVNAGWNLIGSLSYPSLTTEVVPLGGVSVLSSYFAFIGGFGYASTDTLEPGRAYWVKMSQPGALVLRSGSLMIPPSISSPSAGETIHCEGPVGTAVPLPERAGTITFRDASGQTRQIFLAAETPDIRPSDYELPPPPPGGVFDVRYASQRILETFGAGGIARRSANIALTGAVWPLEVHYSGNVEGLSVSLALLSADGERVHELTGTSPVLLDRAGLVSLAAGLRDDAANSLPSGYRLYQNYPNPFNPATSVRFDLPAASPVRIVLTNSLGQTVMTLLDGVMEAGRHDAVVDCSGLPTGVYFYRMTAGNFSDMKKLVLMK